jgi:lipopolysaccharide/colanic/teichoic acid biosynthesis glycosyltransferase
MDDRARPERSAYERGKRALDLAVAVPAAILLAPLVAALAVLVRRESRGPIFFRQERVGRHGEPFEILKLRTLAPEPVTRPADYLLSAEDARITRVGAFLRRWSLDELPQLWNIVRGDMSLVGPRPTLRYQVEQYSDFQRRRLEVPPGITGWAQIHGRNALTWPQRIELDVWYVDHRSLRLDVEILLRTIPTLFRPGSIYGDAQADWGERRPDLGKGASGHAGDTRAVRNVANDDRAGGDERALADPHALDHDRADADVGIVTDVDEAG